MAKFCFIIILFLHLTFYAQNQKVADSLILQYNSGVYQTDELNILDQIAFNESKADIKLQYAEVIINKASRDSLFEFLYSGHLYKGKALQSQGKNVLALESFYKSEKYAIRSGNQEHIGSALLSIAATYEEIENYSNAKRYYKQSLNELRKSADSIGVANSLNQLGNLYINEGKLDSALIFIKEARDIFNLKDDITGIAYSIGYTGIIYAKKGNDDIAEIYLRDPIEVLDELKDFEPICIYLTYLSDIYLRKNDWKQALAYAQSSLDIAVANHLKEQISDAHFKLSQLYEHIDDHKTSNIHLKMYYSYRDSLTDIATFERMANMSTSYELSQKQIEVDLLNEKQEKQRLTVTSAVIAVVLITLLAIGLMHRNRYIQKTSHIIRGERDRSENLLCNILPEKTAQELKEIGKVEAKHFESVSVMFTDFKAFTIHSDQLSPEELVESVDYYFSKFDEIMEKYGLEKIKTIGDAYMCAGGLPFPTHDHAHKIVEAAFEIADFVSDSKNEDPNNLTKFDIRIGINTGPVVAGVVGTKKFAYDIWGNTVNIASRMESNSEIGKINISENTYQLIKDDYCCSFRGEIKAKHKGKMKMYFVNGKKDHDQSETIKERAIRTIRLDDYKINS